jgi:3-hydroxyacyl-CoA dehydrogenase
MTMSAETFGPVTLAVQGPVAIVRMDSPPVNALSEPVRSGLVAAFASANGNGAVKAIVLTGGGRAFSAGADITEFGKGRTGPPLFEVVNVIEASPKPVVAAVNGLALGGGLEIALGCHYRVASSAAKQLGLPEVKIGIVPGAGGTQRLPRLIGVEPALDMITSGAPVSAQKANALGFVDQVADGDVVAAAVAFANDLVAKGTGPRRASEIKIDAATLTPDLFDKRRAAVARHPSGPVAAKACIEAVEGAVTKDFASGLKREVDLCIECMGTPYAKALQYAFFAERQAGNIPGIGASVALREIKSVGVLGAGTMGTGITLAFLQAGIPVTIVEMKQEPLDKGVQRIRETIEGNVKRGRMTAEQGAAIAKSLTPSLDMASFATVDLVIEAVFESMAVKLDVFGKLDAICKPGAILASNTSTLDVDAIAAATKRPQDVLGLHFFSPANIMRLLEIVRGKATADDVLATAMALSKRINKVGVVSGVCFGFIGNRMLESYGEEVQAMLLEGATPADVDKALESWGWAMGPLAVMDLAGIDVGWRIRKEHAISAERKRLYRVTDAIADSGRFGQKTGAGYYKYGSDRKRVEDPEVTAMFRAEAARQGIEPRNGIPAEEIVERTLLRLVNTGAEILDEGIALRASDIDTIYLNGYGFLAWRGGPMWQADAMGLAKVAERIKFYEAKYGERWKVAALIERLAKDGGTFAGLDKAKARG